MVDGRVRIGWRLQRRLEGWSARAWSHQTEVCRRVVSMLPRCDRAVKFESSIVPLKRHGPRPPKCPRHSMHLDGKGAALLPPREALQARVCKTVMVRVNDGSVNGLNIRACCRGGIWEVHGVETAYV